MSFQHWQDISFYLNEIDKEKDLFGKSEVTAESLESTHKKISYLLEQFKGDLDQKLNKDHVSLILFAVIAGIDEQMSSLDYNHLKARWVPLQKDFYSAYTAGEVFFKMIDDNLDKPGIPDLVYEVFYYILKRGFQGKYKDSKTQLQKYLDLLKQKIPVSSPHLKSIAPDQNTPSESLFKPWHYYAFALIVFVVLYVGLYFFSNWRQ